MRSRTRHSMTGDVAMPALHTASCRDLGSRIASPLQKFREIPGRHGVTKLVVASGYESQKHWMLRSSSFHQEIPGRTEIATFFGLTAGENLCLIGQSGSPTHFLVHKVSRCKKHRVALKAPCDSMAYAILCAAIYQKLSKPAGFSWEKQISKFQHDAKPDQICGPFPLSHTDELSVLAMF